MKRKAKPAATTAPAPVLDSGLVGVASFVVYLAFCPPVSGDKDASEITLVLATLGVTHPTGYPLFTLLGHAFVTALHALGAGYSYAANAWSAVGGGLAMALLHALTARLARGPRWIPLLPVLLVWLNPIWTVETTLAEVYSWHVAWALGLGCFFVSLVRGVGPVSNGRAALWGFLCGVGLAHHLTSAMVSLPLSAGLVLFLVRGKRLEPGAVAAGIAALLVPLFSYAWIAWRAHHPGGYVWPTLGDSWASIFKHISGRTYAEYLGRFAPSTPQQMFLARYVYPFLLPGLVLALVAAGRGRGPGERVIRWSVWSAAALGTLYAFSYGVSDPSSYFLTPMILGFALSATLLTAPSGRVLAALAGLLAVWLSIGWVRIDLERRRQYVGFDEFIHGMWATIPVDSGFVFWRDDMFVRLREFQAFRGEKPGLTIIHPSNLTHEAGRRQFERAFGFDPLADVDLRVPPPGSPRRPEAIERVFDDIEVHINRESPLPVIHFDPKIPTVRLMRKGVASDSIGAKGAVSSP